MTGHIQWPVAKKKRIFSEFPGSGPHLQRLVSLKDIVRENPTLAVFTKVDPKENKIKCLRVHIV